jgi:hypothetical protein
MISYSVYIIVITLQLVLGHPMSPSNNQEVVVTNLIRRADCSVLIRPPPIVLNTPLYLTIRIPHDPLYYDLLPFGPAVGSRNILFRDFRTDPTPNGPNQQIGYVQVQNLGYTARTVYVLGLNGNQCLYPSITIPRRTYNARFIETSWIILPGYLYYLVID